MNDGEAVTRGDNDQNMLRNSQRHEPHWPDEDRGPREPPPDRPIFADIALTRSALRQMPAPQPLIANTLDQGTTALLYGKWGTGKSFIALDWAARVATGRQWQNRHTEQRRVLYIAAEGAYGLRARVDAWETGWDTPIADEWMTFLPRPVNLTRATDLVNLEAFIDWGGYQFVILDTLARCMVGAEENSAKDTGIIIDAMTRLQARTPEGRGVILGVHHAGKDGKTMRGSSAFESGVDTVYLTTKDADTITLERTKRKDGPEHDHHTLRLDPIAGTGSVAISVCRAEGATTSRAVELLSQFASLFGDRGASKTEIIEAVDMPRATLYRALTDVLASGDLIKDGTANRTIYRRKLAGQ
ncbi:MAG: AAA family ATPase [Mycobacterium sp.]